MPSYTVRFVRRGHDVGLVSTTSAQDDATALAQARLLRPTAHKCQLWLEQRLVAKLNAAGRLERRQT